MAGVQCLKRLYLVVHEPQLVAQPDGADKAMIKQEISWITCRPHHKGAVLSATLDVQQANRAGRKSPLT
jgi:hypothetical protein